VCCRHRTEHKDRMFNISTCDPAVHKRCSFLQLTTTYCGMWAGLRKDVSFEVHHSAGSVDPGQCIKAPCSLVPQPEAQAQVPRTLMPECSQ